MGEGYISQPSETNPEICEYCIEVAIRIAKRPPRHKELSEVEKEVHAEFKLISQQMSGLRK